MWIKQWSCLKSKKGFDSNGRFLIAMYGYVRLGNLCVSPNNLERIKASEMLKTGSVTFCFITSLFVRTSFAVTNEVGNAVILYRFVVKDELISAKSLPPAGIEPTALKP